MKWTILFGIVFSLSALAEVSPEEVTLMLDQMVRENVISKEEAEKTKIKMKNMSADQWNKVNGEAQKVAARSPASVTENNTEDVNKIDLDGAQFKQIQEDIQKIVPKKP